MGRILAFFSTPARQAAGWVALALLGLGMAAGGVALLDRDGSGTNRASADAATPTATATATATRTATPSPSPSPSTTPTETPTSAPTARPAANTGTNIVANPTPIPPAEPTAEATPAPVAGGAYCPPRNVGLPTLPSGRVAGAVKVAGVDAPAGTVDVFLAFDGVLGPSVKNSAGAFRIDFYANVSGCANQVGAAISAYANGQYFPTGRSVGDGGGQLIPVTVDLP